MKVNFGAIITGGRGKIGGHYVSRNHYGNFQGTCVTPINPSSGYQSARRGAFLFLSGNWRNLSPSDQSSWIEGAVNFPKTDVFGNTYYSTGKNLYVGLNLNLYSIGQSYIDTCPTAESIIPLPDLDTPVFTSPSTSVRCNFTGNLTDTTSIVAVEITPGISAGIFQPTWQYRLVTSQAQTGTNGYEFKIPWSARFTSFNAGDKLFFKVYTIQIGSGQMGVPLIISGIAT